jgi:hypothetical protein
MTVANVRCVGIDSNAFHDCRVRADDKVVASEIKPFGCERKEWKKVTMPMGGSWKIPKKGSSNPQPAESGRKDRSITNQGKEVSRREQVCQRFKNSFAAPHGDQPVVNESRWDGGNTARL